MTWSWSWTYDEQTILINPTMHMSHITQYTIENKNVHIFVLNVVCCGIWETCSVRFVKLFNCHRTKSNVIVLWHHQVYFTYTFIYQGIKGWCTYSFINVNGLISVRCYCWNGTQCSHTFSEIKFNDFSGTFQRQNHIFQALSHRYLVHCKYFIMWWNSLPDTKLQYSPCGKHWSPDQ